ncbi:hypothetical protein N7536_012274 [Penicillium majusculum]|nr:hypothetical protein N7536_012274 [Penicillium majusculum]
MDYDTENTMVLTGPGKSVRHKFLDCSAQLLSPTNGWSGVTATAFRERQNYVEVDIAQNDCFGLNENNPDLEVSEYCRSLAKFLCDNAHSNFEAAITEFELHSIRYARRRVDSWMKYIRAMCQDNHD